MSKTQDKASPGLRMAIDFGPLAVFFVVNFLAGWLPLPSMVAGIGRLMAATVAFMVATVIALFVSWIKTGHVSPMLWISGVLVLVFGGLTLYFHDETFIKMKPTIVYAIFAVVLGYGVATGRPVLEQLLSTAYPGLDATGWRKLSINWTVFFVFMAILNETVWRTADAYMAPRAATNAWVLFKFPGCAIITLVFAAANIPMLLRHGLTMDAPEETPLPPEG